MANSIQIFEHCVYFLRSHVLVCNGISKHQILTHSAPLGPWLEFRGFTSIGKRGEGKEKGIGEERGKREKNERK